MFFDTNPKIILGIETSCDETAAAILKKDNNGIQILSNIIASSAEIQSKYGGVIPEQAAREQLVSIIPVIKEALEEAKCKPKNIDALAVTYGPGLVGCLLIGVETAKTLSLVWEKPLVPVNHLLGHFYANWITDKGTLLSPDTFPIIGLLVSGGHTDLILMENHGKYRYLGGTRDDAAGEAFDKTARLLGLPYPGGPAVSKLAKQGNPKAFKLPRPMIKSDNLDFSFSGLKTAVSNIILDGLSPSGRMSESFRADLAASIEEAIIDVLVAKTKKAAKQFNVNQIMLAGGVAANKKLTEVVRKTTSEQISHAPIYVPPPHLCTDNAAFIAACAFYNFHPVNPLTLQASPGLSLDKKLN